MTKFNLNVNGMHCKSCSMLIKEALEEIGASNIKINLDEKKQVGKVSFDYKGNKEEAIKAIEKEGYSVT